METQIKFVMEKIMGLYEYMISQNVALKKANIEVPPDALENLKNPNLQIIVFGSLATLVKKSRKTKPSDIADLAELARTLPMGTKERIDALIDLSKAVAHELADMAIGGLESVLATPGLPEEKAKEFQAQIERLNKSALRIDALIEYVDRRNVAKHVGLPVLVVYDHLSALLKKEEDEANKSD